MSAVALVTGGARRIGASIVSTLHARGYDVVIHCRRSRRAAEALAAELERERAGSVVVVTGNLAEVLEAEQVAAAALAWRGRCDLLVNNASSFYATPLGAVDEAHWDDLVGSNLKGPFFLTQALAQALQAARGAVVNVADVHAERPLPAYPVYSVAKAGLAMMTRALALELAPAVRVNTVAPGTILWPEHEDAAASAPPIAGIPLGRSGEPGDIAGAVAYLAGARYVTGQLLAVDGGRSVVTA